MNRRPIGTSESHSCEFHLLAIREEFEDMLYYLDVLEARGRDEGKPRLAHAEVKRRYGLK